MWVKVAMASSGRLIRAREGRRLELSVDSSLNKEEELSLGTLDLPHSFGMVGRL